VSGSQVYGSSTPVFTGTYTTPTGVTVVGTITCTETATTMDISGTLDPGTYTIDATSCSGLSTTTGVYDFNYSAKTTGFSVSQATILVSTVQGHMGFGTSNQTFTGKYAVPLGATVTGTITCTKVTLGTTAINASLAPGTYTIKASTCSGLKATTGDYTFAYVAKSSGFTVYKLPATPVTVTATAGVSSAKVSWSEPTTGGTPTSFTIHSTPSVAAVTAPGTATSAKVPGLKAGTSYTFTVTASNTGGTSAASAPSNPVVPTSVAPQGTKSASGTDPSASTQKSPVTISASTTGSGTLTVATYPSDPVAALSAGTTYFDVHTAPGGTFSAVTVSVCGLTSGQTLSWWNPAAQAWQEVSPQSALSATGCVTANLSPTSTPTVAQLVGTVFATSVPVVHTTTNTRPPPPPPSNAAGYDMVGSDGGVFVFSPPGTTGGFFGSLPGLGVKVNNIVGMVPTANDQGYFLVGSDGGVFAFGNAPFLGSLPGLGVKPSQPITGLVPTGTDGGYFLVGKDGGVFAFGNAQYLGSLPGIGVHRDDIIGIAATPSGNGYWLVAADGTVYGFGAAQTLGSATGTSSPVTAIAGTPDGGGYWIVTQNGSVHAFGDAKSFGTLPALGVSPTLPVIGIVHTADTGGYWLIGADGGIFAFGDAGFVGSLPGVGVHVNDVVGAVPTTV
jgi:hypothetical protein